MREQRKHYYNDHRLQGYLITALVLIELLLVLALLAYLYVEFNRVIDARFYRIHGSDEASWPAFLTLLAQAVGGFLLVNAAALYLAHLIWDRYVKHTVDLFADGLDKMIALDFGGAAEARARQHRIIDLLDSWRARERQRNAEIAHLVDRLSAIGDDSSGATAVTEPGGVLEDYRRLLRTPQAAR